MTELPAHPVSQRLALLALCGDLVVAIDALSIRAIRRLDDTPARASGRGRSVLELDGRRLPGLDLGDLLGIDDIPSAWVIVDLPGISTPIAFRIGRCVTVESLPVCRAVPRAIFSRRPRAIAAAFSTAAFPELADRISGVVIDLASALGDRERAFVSLVGKEGRGAVLEA